MILVMDVGNTNIKIGLYGNDNKLKNTWRIATNFQNTADEYGMTLLNLFTTVGVKFSDIDGIIISSVAPTLNYTLEHTCRYYMKQPIFVGPGIKTGINIKYTNPAEVGADRIVSAVAAYKLYGGPVIVIDFGTATTFGVVSAQGEFLGGAIAPGIKSSMEAMVNTAAKLPRIELVKPQSVINKTTVSNMQSGVVYGFIGMVDNMIARIKKEINAPDCKVIATGGMSVLVSSEVKAITTIDRALTIKGLKILYDMNVSETKEI